MRKTMLLTLAAASLAAGPALALPPPPCSGNACAVVAPVPANGCWAFRNSSERTVRGLIHGGNEFIIFVMAPGAAETPHWKSGACYSSAGRYQMDYQADPKGAKRR